MGRSWRRNEGNPRYHVTANTLTADWTRQPRKHHGADQPTRAGDQYSLGVLYYCLAGQYPFGDGTAVEKMMAHQFKQPTPIREVAPDAPDGLSTVIDRLMQKAPDARYPGVDDLVEALQPYAVQPNRAGSRFAPAPAVRVAPSNPGSRFPSPAGSVSKAPPPAGSVHVPTPTGGPFTPVPDVPAGGSKFGFGPASHASGSSNPGLGSSVPGSKVGGSVPGSKVGGSVPGSKIGPSRLPTARPAPVKYVAPTRAAGKSRSQVPTAIEAAIPMALPSNSQGPAPFALPATGRITSLDDATPPGMSLLFKALFVLVVVISVFVIGKAFLFRPDRRGDSRNRATESPGFLCRPAFGFGPVS